MSDQGWIPPGATAGPVRPHLASPEYVAPPEAEVAAPNWGIAHGGGYTGYAGAAPPVLVPRPPRPGVVTLAIGLALVGVVISGAERVGAAIYTWTRRQEIVDLSMGDAPSADLEPVMSTSLTFGIAVDLVIWLLAAAGVVVCAVLAWRGRNPARIVLASLGGTFVLANVCGVTGALLAESIQPGGPFSPTIEMTTWWLTTLQVVLGLVAAAMTVPLLLPAANRYFSAGPGRRFVVVSSESPPAGR